WRPVSQYFDLDGILNPDQNRETFKRFVSDFGWKEYMFSPVVRSFSKLLEGRSDYNYEDYNALGFTRLPDRSFERLGGHNRAFRHGHDVMMSAVYLQIPQKKLDTWCKQHPGIRYVICQQKYDFHYQGRGFLVLFMTDAIATKYAKILDEYREA
ncbi:MAG: hypothetical protein IIZ37_10805, partial [Acinetobacter sp.]|nr:hypothetical protein [Acinetobacter sp.]